MPFSLTNMFEASFMPQAKISEIQWEIGNYFHSSFWGVLFDNFFCHIEHHLVR